MRGASRHPIQRSRGQRLNAAFLSCRAEASAKADASFSLAGKENEGRVLGGCVNLIGGVGLGQGAGSRPIRTRDALRLDRTT